MDAIARPSTACAEIDKNHSTLLTYLVFTTIVNGGASLNNDLSNENKKSSQHGFFYSINSSQNICTGNIFKR